MAEASLPGKISLMKMGNLYLAELISKLSGGRYPWNSPMEFFESPEYLGARLYPAQRLLLKIWNLQTDFTPWERKKLNEWTHPGLQGDEDYKSGLPGDVLDRIEFLKEKGHEWFPLVVAVMGRRAGKTFLTGLQLSYCAACFLFTQNWGHGADLGHGYELIVMATTESQARTKLFADFYSATLRNPFFTPYLVRALPSKIEFATIHDQLRSEAVAKSRRKKVTRGFVSLTAQAVSSNTAGGRGGAVPFFAFDEGFFALAGESSRSGNAAIQAYTPAMAQFSPHQMAIFPSSPRNRSGMLYHYYQQGLNTQKSGEWDPDVLVCQLESWKMYEQ